MSGVEVRLGITERRHPLARTCAWSERQVLLIIPVCVCPEHTTRAHARAGENASFSKPFLPIRGYGGFSLFPFLFLVDNL